MGGRDVGTARHSKAQQKGVVFILLTSPQEHRAVDRSVQGTLLHHPRGTARSTQHSKPPIDG